MTTHPALYHPRPVAATNWPRCRARAGRVRRAGAGCRGRRGDDERRCLRQRIAGPTARCRSVAAERESRRRQVRRLDRGPTTSLVLLVLLVLGSLGGLADVGGSGQHLLQLLDRFPGL